MVKFDAETKSHYWLTVCAQDHGIVPLHSCCEVCDVPSVVENILCLGIFLKNIFVMCRRNYLALYRCHKISFAPLLVELLFFKIFLKVWHLNLLV
jgi:hypothetical protein